MSNSSVYDASNGAVKIADLLDFSSLPTNVAGLLPGDILKIDAQSEFGFGSVLDPSRLCLSRLDSKISALSLFEGSKVFSGCPPRHFLYERSGNQTRIILEKMPKDEAVDTFNIFGEKIEAACSDVFDAVYWLALEETVKDVNVPFSIFRRFGIERFYCPSARKETENPARSLSQYYQAWKAGEDVWNEATNNLKKLVLSALSSDKDASVKYVRKCHGKMRTLF